MAKFQRRETPPNFSNYQNYKPFLRADFLAQCAYCERNEHYLGGEEAFEVEHFKPKAKFPKLSCSYPNLYYVCRKCNSYKSDTWPSQEEIALGLRFADPCAEDFYIDHAREREDNQLEPLTPCGRYSSTHIRLHRKELLDWRRQRAEARKDLPWLTAVNKFLERLRAEIDPSDAACDELVNGCVAIRRRIEESKLRFALG